MRVQIDRFEDGAWVVVLAHPEGRTAFDVRVERDGEETGRLAEENRRLLDGLAGGGG